MTRDDLKVGATYKRKNEDTFRTIIKIYGEFVRAVVDPGFDVKLSIRYFLAYYELVHHSKEEIKQLINKLEL